MPRVSELQSTPALAPGDLVYVVADGVSSRLASLRVANIAAMVAITTPINGMSVEVIEDGRGGMFVFDTSLTAAADNGTTFKATDATTGSWSRRFDGPVNVKWFGAKGDGVTDDTAAFSSFLASGSSLHIPEGEYNLATWTVYGGSNDINLYGTGRPLVTGPGYSGVGAAAFLASLGNIHIEGIKFSNFVNVCASVPTSLNDYFKFVDNETMNTFISLEFGVTTEGCGYRDVIIEGNVVRDTSYGVRLFPRELHNTTIINNTFKDHGNAWGSVDNVQAVMVGLDTAPGTRLNAVVSGNIIQNIINSGSGETTAIMMHDVRRCTVNDNVIDTVTGGAGEGIYLRRSDMDATCVGNTIVDCEQICIAGKLSKSLISNNRISGRNLTPLYGIGQVESVDCVVDSNYITNCYCGISSLSAAGSGLLQSRIEISNNVITDSVRCGIYAAGRSRTQVVTGNKIKRVTGGTVIPLSGLGPDDINVGIDTSYTTGDGTRCVFTNNHVSQVLGSASASGDGLDSVGFRLRSTVGEIFASVNSYDTVEYGFWVEQLVYLNNNYLRFAQLGVYHPSSAAADGSALQAYRAAGVSFPANHAAMVTDQNTLDAYAEGEWTPTIGRTTTFGTYVPAAEDGGKYTRVGNLVFFSCRVGGTNTTASGGVWVVRGLPFSSADNASWARTPVIGHSETAGADYPLMRIIEGSTDIQIPTWVSGETVYCSGFYFIE